VKAGKPLSLKGPKGQKLAHLEPRAQVKEVKADKPLSLKGPKDPKDPKGRKLAPLDRRSLRKLLRLPLRRPLRPPTPQIATKLKTSIVLKALAQIAPGPDLMGFF
jgi:hypothetical protein